MSRKKPQAPCRPSTLGEKGYAGIPVCVMKSAAYRSLSLRARAILFEIAARMNGYNNGKIGLSYAEIRECTGCCNRDIASAMNELWQHGLVEVTHGESWNQHKAREYRLTFVSSVSGAVIMPATNEYRDWKPSADTPPKRKSRGDEAQPATPSAGDTVQPAPQSAGDEAQPAKKSPSRKTANNDASPPWSAGDTVQPHIYNHARTADEPTPAPPFRGKGPSDGVQRNDDEQSSSIINHHCEQCGEGFDPGKRMTKRFCNEACRKRAEKNRHRDRCKYGDGDSVPVGNMAAAILARAVA